VSTVSVHGGAGSVLSVSGALAGRSLLMIRRVPAVVLPTLIFPIVIVVAFSGAYGALTRLPGFPVRHMIDWMLPMSIVQGSAFAGVNAGLGLIRDLEGGFFDRLRLAPTSRLSLVTGPLLGAVARAVIPLVIVLCVGVLAGAHLRGGVLAVVMLMLASLGAATISAGWAIGLALRLRSMRAAPLMQVGIFATIFMSTAQVPLAVMTGWLKSVARVNPTTYILQLARQGFIGSVTWSHTWPGLLALTSGVFLLTGFAVRGLASFDRD
jgi:ABC-2 type transport system permease protein